MFRTVMGAKQLNEKVSDSCWRSHGSTDLSTKEDDNVKLHKKSAQQPQRRLGINKERWTCQQEQPRLKQLLKEGRSDKEEICSPFKDNISVLQ
jgi:hypothetical protein